MSCYTDLIKQADYISLDKYELNYLFIISNLCKLSYMDPKELNNINNNLNLITNTFIFINNENTDAQAYIFYTTSTIYVCFRGTTSLKDKIIDLNILMTQFLQEKVYVHSGFYNQYTSIIENIKKHITNILILYKQKNIICCGHSLGGALATLTAVDLKLTTFQNINIQCITFGSPRVGNKYFCSLYKQLIQPFNNIKSYRIVDHNDPIQYVPLNYKYNHIDNSLCFYNDKIINKKEKKWYYRFCNTLSNLNYNNIIKEHSIINYIDLIKNQLES